MSYVDPTGEVPLLIPLVGLISGAIIGSAINNTPSPRKPGGANDPLGDAMPGGSAPSLPLSIPKAQEQCQEDTKCDPPKGTICYMIDRVPPSKPHYPVEGSHYHLWQMNQAPNGKCFWNKLDASRTAPPGAIPCPFARPPR